MRSKVKSFYGIIITIHIGTSYEKKLLTWHLFLLVPQVHRPVAVREPVPLCDVFGIAHVREHSVLLPEALLADEAEVHAPVTSIRLSSTDDQIRVVTQDCTNRPLDRLVELGSRELRRGRHGTRLGVSNVLQHFFFLNRGRNTAQRGNLDNARKTWSAKETQEHVTKLLRFKSNKR